MFRAIIERVRRAWRNALGWAIPLIGRAIVPCNMRGEPSFDPDEAEHTEFETGAVVFAWFGWSAVFPFGDVMLRQPDPKNPKRFMPGDLFT